MTTPGPTSTPHSACCRRATATSTPSPARSPPPRWRGRSATPPAPARRSAEPWSTRRSRRFPAIAWQLVWLGLRVEAEASEPAPDRVAALAALSGELPATTPPALAYRALADAESAAPAGATRTGRGDRGLPEGRGPVPHRVRAAAPGARSACAAADRESRVGRRSGGRAAGRGARRGAAARRRARARAPRAPADRRGRARGRAGRGRDRRVRADPARARGAPSCSPTGARTRRSPKSCSSAARPRASTCRTSSASSASRAAARPPPWPIA